MSTNSPTRVRLELMKPRSPRKLPPAFLGYRDLDHGGRCKKFHGHPVAEKVYVDREYRKHPRIGSVAHLVEMDACPFCDGPLSEWTDSRRDFGKARGTVVTPVSFQWCPTCVRSF